MKIKTISKNVYKSIIINEWLKPEGFDLSICCVSEPVMKIALNIVYGDYKEFARFIKQQHAYDTEYESCVAMCLQVKKDGVAWNYINIQNNNWTAEHYGTMVHELHHFTHFALDEKGISYGSAGEELYAYVQGYFMEMLVRAFIELGKIKKKK